jgi:predicted nuclease of predicted toxin-antitoxin system
MRFLVDHNMGRGVAIALRLAGYDTAFVGETDPAMPDRDVLAWAVREERIVVTQDPDFGALVYRLGQPHAGVLFMRMPGADRIEKIRVLFLILEEHGAQLPGRFAVYEGGRLRLRETKAGTGTAGARSD